jgi:hypothetical protein
LAGDDGKGNASTSSAEAEPDLVQHFELLAGETFRSLCQDWVASCSTIMSTAPACSNISPRWITNWKKTTLVNLDEELFVGSDEEMAMYDQDSAATFVRRLFQYNLMRRIDGPTKDGRDFVMRHVKELAAERGLDLGSVEC